MSEGQAARDGRAPEGVESTPNVPARYRHTEVGVIPEDWASKAVREVAPLQRGFDLPTSRIRTGPHPVVYSNGVLRHHHRAMVKGPGVVTGRSGTIGKVHFVAKDFWPHNTAFWVVSYRGNDPKFVYYLYSHIDFSRFLSGSGVPTLNRNDVHQYLTSIPPVSEQCAIAAALSDVDELIGSLDALIDKKHVIKQAVMQQLLTGKTRLLGFVGEWVRRRIDELADVDPENLPGSTDPGFLFNYISLDHVETGRLLGYSRELFETAPSRARRVVRTSDVLMSTVRPALKGHLLFSGQVPNAVCSTGFAILRSKRDHCDPRFLFAHLFGEVVGTQVQSLLAGSNYPAINSRDVGRLRVPCPPTLAEQRAIATVLSDMDAEIAAVERRLAKTRAVKQGMMQQLLTGSIRLPVLDNSREGDIHGT